METIHPMDPSSLPTLSPSVPLTADEFPLWTSAPVSSTSTGQPISDTTPLRRAVEAVSEGTGYGRELRSPGGILKWASGFNPAPNLARPKAVSFGENTVVYITPRHMTVESSVSTLDSIPSQPGSGNRSTEATQHPSTQQPSLPQSSDESQWCGDHAEADEAPRVMLIEAIPAQINGPPPNSGLQWRGRSTAATDPPTSPRVTTPATVFDPDSKPAAACATSLGLDGLRLQYSPETDEGVSPDLTGGSSSSVVVSVRKLVEDDPSTTDSLPTATPTLSDNLLKQYIRSTAGILQQVVGHSEPQLNGPSAPNPDPWSTAVPSAFQPVQSDPDLTPQLSSSRGFAFSTGVPRSIVFPDSVDPNPTPLFQGIQPQLGNVVAPDEGFTVRTGEQETALPSLSFHITSAEGLLMQAVRETQESPPEPQVHREMTSTASTSHSRSPTSIAGGEKQRNRKSSSTSPTTIAEGKTPNSVSPRKRKRARSSEIFRDDIALGMAECREPNSPVLKLGPLLDASEPGSSFACENHDAVNVGSETGRAPLQGGPVICALCHQERIHDLNGRDDPLLHLDGYWVHRCCALWSPEVTTDPEVPERFQNVGDAVLRGQEIKCALCRTPGATLGCVDEACQRSYHFPCAVALTSQSPTSDGELDQHRAATSSRSSSAGRGPLRMVRKQYYIQCPRHAQH